MMLGWRASAYLNTLSDQEATVSTIALFDLVSDGVQMIEGRLEARLTPEAHPFLSITAVRSDEWDVESSEDAILEAVRQAFNEVDELPG
jgi:hypothetical protein